MKRGGYYPDTMSPAARRVDQARRDVAFWQDHRYMAAGLEHLALADQVLRWRAAELIEASTLGKLELVDAARAIAPAHKRTPVAAAVAFNAPARRAFEEKR